MTDLDLLDLIIGLYAYPGTPPVQWDHLDTGGDDDGVYWAAKRVGKTWGIVNRGSADALDFERDFDTIAVPVRGLGMVHGGFYTGLPEQWDMVRQIIGGDPWVATGHSLGAGRCCQLAGLAMRDGKPPLAYVRFGEPRPGFQELADLLAPVPGRSYRNMDADGHDRVTDVPFDLPPLFPYVHPQPLIDVTASPAPGDAWGPWRYHRAELYREALAKLPSLPMIGGS